METNLVKIYFNYPNGGRGARVFRVKEVSQWLARKTKEWTKKGYYLIQERRGKMIEICGYKGNRKAFLLYTWPDLV